MSHGASNTGILRTNLPGRSGSMLRTGKVMIGLTLIGLISTTTIPAAGTRRPGKSGLIASNRSVRSMVMLSLRAGNTGVRKTRRIGFRSLISRTGKVTTGKSSIGVILKSMMTLTIGMIETGKTGLIGNKTKLINNRNVSARKRNKVKVLFLRLRTGLNLRPSTVKMRKTRKFARTRTRSIINRSRRTRRKSNAIKERRRERLLRR